MGVVSSVKTSNRKKWWQILSKAGRGGGQTFTTKYGSYKEDQYFDVWLRECNSDKFFDTLRVGEGFMDDVIKLETLTCSDGTFCEVYSFCEETSRTATY